MGFNSGFKGLIKSNMVTARNGVVVTENHNEVEVYITVNFAPK